MGLSGLGDLVLTATGDLSRNRRVGLVLAAGQPLAQILAELGHVAEGVSQRADGAARAPPRRASRCRSSPPSSRCSTAALAPEQALEQLMRREAPRAESSGVDRSDRRRRSRSGARPRTPRPRPRC